jgi:hypothetical protein
VRRLLLLSLLAASPALVSCASQTPYATSIGVLHPGQRLVVRIARGIVNAYAPAIGDPRDRFTIEAFASGTTAPPAPQIRLIPRGIEVDAPVLQSLLVRVPDDVALTVVSGGGDVNVTDIGGSARVTTTSGEVTMMLPDYGAAQVLRHGDISVKIGASSWPGTLHFSTPRGSIDLSVNENDRFHALLTTLDGTIFTDFNLRGGAKGTEERIASLVNGGSPYGIAARTGKGPIRLLRLAPQY